MRRYLQAILVCILIIGCSKKEKSVFEKAKENAQKIAENKKTKLDKKQKSALNTYQIKKLSLFKKIKDLQRKRYHQDVMEIVHEYALVKDEDFITLVKPSVDWYNRQRNAELIKRKFKEEKKIKANNKEKLIQQQFHNGTHIQLVRAVKQKMHNPDSFEHVKTTYEEHENYIIVTMEFRGRNGFNAKILKTVKAKYSTYGKLKEILK
ncbi:MAG: hypothetical protein NE334_21705 [Lentisphaeraceae bacterium]|nr:hypothetical protein [Lentisphaeraceae bacterium]